MGDIYSDYGSGRSSNSSSSLLWQEKKVALQSPPTSQLDPTSSSYINLIRKCTLEDVRREFQLNGSDSPYNPDEDNMWQLTPTAPLSASGTPRNGPRDACDLGGMGPAAQYLRQKSWPAPERTPAPRLPRPRSLHEPRWIQTPQATSTPVFEGDTPAPFTPDVLPSEVYANKQLTEEQRRVLHTIPDNVLYPLLRKLRFYWHFKECRFCKNNGERMSYYRSHVLKDITGRVLCPVLRAFTCPRCGAGGDYAHTIKYCPLSTNEERIHSAGMMHSVRMASGRRRYSIASPDADYGDYFTFGETTPFVVDNNSFSRHTELPPGWAALEQKLLQ